MNSSASTSPINRLSKDHQTHLDSQSTQWLNVIMLWLAGVYAAMQFAKFSSTYDLLLQYYQTSSTTISLALSSVGIMGLIFGTIAGVLSGKLGHKKVLILSLLLGCLLSFSQSFLPRIEYLLVTRVLEGLSHLGVVVSAPTLMIAISAKKHQAISMGLWGTFFGVAFALMGWFSPFFVSEGLGALYQFHSLLSLPLILYLVFCLKLPQTKSTDIDDSASDSNQPLDFIHLFNDLAKVYQSIRTLLPGLVFLFHTSMFVALLTFIPRLSEDEQTKNQLFVLLPLVSIVGTFLAGVLAQYWFSAQRVGTLAYSGVALFSILTFMNIESPTHFYTFALCLLLFSGLVAGSAFAMITFLAKDHDQQAKSNGAIAQLGNLGASIGPPLFAAILSLFDSIGMLVLIIGLCLSGITLTLYANRFKQD